jgi:hypothetical protein
MIAAIIEMHQVELGRSAARPRLRAGIADGVPAVHRSLAIDRAGRKKKGLGEAGLAGAAGAHKRDGAASLASRSAGDLRSFGHDRLLPSARAVRVRRRGKERASKTEGDRLLSLQASRKRDFVALPGLVSRPKSTK